MLKLFPMESVYSLYRKLVVNPKYRWWVIGATLAYVLSPIDIAPDFLPLIGELDDAVVVSLLVTELVGVLRDRKSELKAETKKNAVPTEFVTKQTIDTVAVEVV
jgi:uncharacterized membrane protein YkvA (DUF1232 family)